MEYGTTVFSPTLKKYINLLESVQNNFTRKLVMRCSGLEYRFIPSSVDRRVVLKLHSLHSRRIKNDLVMAFKILAGMTPLKPERFFKFFSSPTKITLDVGSGRRSPARWLSLCWHHWWPKADCSLLSNLS